MSRSRSRRRCSHLSPKAKFYKSLRGYIITLLAIFTAAVFIDDDIFDLFRIVAFWWGIGLAVQYLKVRGLPGTRGWLSDDWFDWIQSRHPNTNTDKSDYQPKPDKRNGEDYDPLWKDKDLV